MNSPHFEGSCGAFLKMIAAVVIGLLAGTAAVRAQSEPHRFEADILSFEAMDRTSPPHESAILFVGDSTFTRWAIEEDLPEYRVINRGFGGSEMADLLHFTDRIVLPYKPRLIVVQEGGNDLHEGRTPEQLLADIKEFIEKVRQTLPEVPIAIGSMAANPGRWNEADIRKTTNGLIKDYATTVKNVFFMNFFETLLAEDGKPREDLFVEDRVHPNASGYRMRAEIMRPILGAPDR